MDESRRKRTSEKPRRTVGKGIPNYFMPVVRRRKSEQANFKKELTPSEFSAFSASLNLEEYKFDDEVPKGLKGGPGGESEMDVTALDRYNDEVRRYRKVLIDECRNLPNMPTIDTNLEVLEDAIQKLCRNAYYGTAKAQKLAEGGVPLLVWLLNRKYFQDQFHINLLKSLSEMCWTCIGLKNKFQNAHGTKVVYQHMSQVSTKKRVACWCAYAMGMMACGSAEMILGARKIRGLEELVAEISFEYYWYDWPVNFGMLLQGILYGPNSVSPTEELFQFQ